MGFFDFLRRKKDKPPEPDFSEGDLPEPRCHHYTLAHYALRSLAFEDPLAFLAVLASPDASAFLADLFDSVSQHCRETEPRADFGVEDLTLHRGRVGKYPCAIIEMPPPRGVTEAFFVAAVVLVDLEEEPPESEKVEMRYFTLEMGMTLEGPTRTVLCEWTSEGSHLNFGDGPPPRLKAFVQAMEERMSGG